MKFCSYLHQIGLFAVTIFLLSCKSYLQYDHIIRNAMIYDGTGSEGYRADIGINADTIAFIGDLSKSKGKLETDAKGMAVAPGFINMLSWANQSLLIDGKSESDLLQGVTLEVMGEGESMGPLNAGMKAEMIADMKESKVDVSWTTLGEYLNHLEKKGISCNVASFVGATTLRIHVVGEDDRQATDAELDSMKLLVRQAMEEGAMGVGSSLIYPPAFFASTKELTELCKAASTYNGMYISHMRSEGNKLYEAVEELMTIAKDAKIRAEIYHLKAAGKANWLKMDSVIHRIERAQKEGLEVAANMYNYTAGGTGLTACLPPALQDGGFGKLWQRLHDANVRAQTKKAINTNAMDWENFFVAAGSPENILLVGFTKDSLRKYTGKTLLEVAQLKGTPVEETLMDLIIQDSSRIGTIYFLMDEQNLRKQIVQPWMGFGSDEGSYTNHPAFLKSNAHPRAYGNFAKVLAKYCREEKLISLPEAIRKLSGLSAQKLRLQKRGVLKVGYFADVIIFDPQKIQDHATFSEPRQFATGMQHVFVNGKQVIQDGKHTGVFSGRFVKGPGWKQNL